MRLGRILCVFGIHSWRTISDIRDCPVCGKMQRKWFCSSDGKWYWTDRGDDQKTTPPPAPKGGTGLK